MYTFFKEALRLTTYPFHFGKWSSTERFTALPPPPEILKAVIIKCNVGYSEKLLRKTFLKALKKHTSGFSHELLLRIPPFECTDSWSPDQQRLRRMRWVDYVNLEDSFNQILDAGHTDTALAVFSERTLEALIEGLEPLFELEVIDLEGAMKMRLRRRFTLAFIEDEVALVNLEAAQSAAPACTGCDIAGGECDEDGDCTECGAMLVSWEEAECKAEEWVELYYNGQEFPDKLSLSLMHEGSNNEQ
jgi:hypothetical protein